MRIALFLCLSTAFILPIARAADQLPDGAAVRLGELNWRFAEHSDEPSRYAWLPDSSGVVACGQETIRLFDARTGAVIRDWKADRDSSFLSVAVSPDSAMLGATDGRNVNLWEIKTGRLIRTLRLAGETQKDNNGLFSAKPSNASLIAFSPDGKRLLASGRTLQLWDLKSGKLLRTWSLTWHIGAIGFLPDDRTVFGVGSNGYFQCDPDSSRGSLPQLFRPGFGNRVNATGTVASSIAQFHGSEISGESELGEGVVLFDPKAGETFARLDEKGLTPNNSVFFSASGKQICTVSRSQDSSNFRLSTWSVPDGKRISSCLVRMYFHGPMLPSPDGEKIALLSNQPQLRLVDTRTGGLLSPANTHAVPPVAAAFSMDGQTLLSGGGASYDDEPCNLILWDTRTGRSISSIPDDCANSRAILPMPDRQSFVVAAGSENALRFLDARTGREKSRIKNDSQHSLFIEDAMITQRGNLIVEFLECVGQFSEHRFFVTWGIVNGKKLTETERHYLPPGEFVGDGKRRAAIIDMREIDGDSDDFSPRVAVYGGWEREPILWHRLVLGSSYALLASSPNGRTLITTSTRSSPTGRQGRTGMIYRPETSFIQSWDVDTGEERFCVGRLGGDLCREGFGKPLFSPDGRLVVVLWNESEMLFLSPLTGRELGQFKAEIGLTPLAFTQDGNRLATTMADGTILIWDVSKFASRSEKRRISATDIEMSWRDLAGAIRPAVEAMARLEESPSQALALFRERIKPAEPVSEETIHTLIKQLGDRSYAKREAATRVLLRLGEQVHPALREALTAGPDAETRKRIEYLLAEPALVRSPEVRRHLRAIELTAAIATPEAKALLAAWAKGDPAARETKSAKEALERLSP